MSPQQASDALSAVAGEYTALAAVLADVEPKRWDTQSLCSEWRVREVIAHLTMPVRYTPEQFQAELKDCAFDFTTLANRVASRDGQLPIDTLLDNLRSDFLHRWTPPGGGPIGALTHVVIHGLDVTVPLGEPRTCFDASLHTVLDNLTAGGVHRNFGVSIDDVELRAADIDWSYGSGKQVAGTAENVALWLCGRDVEERLDIA